MNGQWIEVFRTGTHTDSKGVVRTYTEADLDGIATKYDPLKHEAPVVVGHPKDNSPAFGWAEKLERRGEKLVAKLKQVVPEFQKAVSLGLYKKRSISLYPDGTLRHIGFLGAEPPAVKALADIGFSESDQATVLEYGEGVDFSDEWETRSIGRLFRRLREWIIAKYGVAEADQVLDEFTVNEIQNAKDNEEIPAPAAGFSETAQEEDLMSKELQEKLAAAEEALAAKDKQVKEFSERLAALETEKQAAEKATRLAAIQTRIDGLKAKGIVTPAMEAGLAAFVEGLDTTEIQFAENVKASPAEFFFSLLEKLPKSVTFGETATADRAATDAPTTNDFAEVRNIDEARMKIHNEATALAAQEKITYSAAVRRVLKK